MNEWKGSYILIWNLSASNIIKNFEAEWKDIQASPKAKYSVPRIKMQKLYKPHFIVLYLTAKVRAAEPLPKLLLKT